MSSQSEGSKDLYDFYEYLYSSDMFKNMSTSDIISIAYSFYQVHAGTINFFGALEADLNIRINDKTSTYDLLRIL